MKKLNDDGIKLHQLEPTLYFMLMVYAIAENNHFVSVLPTETNDLSVTKLEQDLSKNF